MAGLRHSRASYWVVALYALAMATLGFAHQPMAIPGSSSFDLAAYALPDGTLPTLCSHDQQTPSGIAVHHCDACALAHAPGLIAPPQICLPAPASFKIAIRVEAAGQFEPGAHHGPNSRGPPLS